MKQHKKPQKLPVSRPIQKLILILTAAIALSNIAAALLQGIYAMQHGANLYGDMSYLPLATLSLLAPLLYFGIAYLLGSSASGRLWRAFIASLFAFAANFLSQIVWIAAYLTMPKGAGWVTMAWLQLIPVVVTLLILGVAVVLTRRLSLGTTKTPLLILAATYILFSLGYISPIFTHSGYEDPITLISTVGAILVTLLFVGATYAVLPTHTPRAVRSLKALLYPVIPALIVFIISSVFSLFIVATNGVGIFLNEFIQYLSISVLVGYLAALIWARRNKRL